MDEIALVIACHKSKDNIIKTLHAAHYFAHFPKVNVSFTLLSTPFTLKVFDMFYLLLIS